jgi:hypothetical protein
VFIIPLELDKTICLFSLKLISLTNHISLISSFSSAPRFFYVILSLHLLCFYQMVSSLNLKVYIGPLTTNETNFVFNPGTSDSPSKWTSFLQFYTKFLKKHQSRYNVSISLHFMVPSCCSLTFAIL